MKFDDGERARAAHLMQSYIAENLNREITMKRLSKAAGYSPCYAAKVFKELTGHAPFEYIRKLRLTGAAKALRDEGGRVLDTALDFEFDSHEGFTRAFSREFGVSPYRYKKEPVPVPYFISYDALIRWHSENGSVKLT